MKVLAVLAHARRCWACAQSWPSRISRLAHAQPYTEADTAGRSVQAEERIGKLERDLAKLEGIVEQLVAGMDAEHRAMKEIRHEDRLALKDLGEKMERSVAGLASEMKRIAERNAAVDNKVLAKQSEAIGALSATRWIIATVIAGAALFLAYQAGERHKFAAPDQPSVERARP